MATRKQRAKHGGKQAAGRTRRRRGARAATRLRSGYQVRDDAIVPLLLSGEHRGLLEEYFGPPHYRELHELAQQAARRAVRGGPRVFILPGIMGSKLGRQGPAIFDDVIWIDPVDIAVGRLAELSLGRDRNVVPLGVVLFAYLKLKLRLQIAGFDAEFHPFDWRQSLARLGREFRRRVLRDASGPVHVVAHSMGGLVTRAALGIDERARGGRRMQLGKFIMLGTPNFGSFVPIRALRASHPLVRKVALIDVRHSPEELAQRVFHTFPGLHEMLPFPARYSHLDLYAADTWPADAPAPSQRMLDGLQAVQDGLAVADERFALICGINQDTLTDLHLKDGKLAFERSRDGDGTVPRAFAELPDTRTYYVEEQHGSLANNRRVGQAVIDILQTGATDRLPQSWDAAAVRERRTVMEAEFRIAAFGGRTRGELSQDDRRSVLEEVVSAEAHDRPPRPAGELPPAAAVEPPVAYTHSLRHVQVDRRRAHAIEICLAHGDLTEVNARALVLGMFRGVEPAGAAAAVDERVDGAVKEFVTRRMFTGDVGDVFMLPTGRHLIYAETVLFAGLGDVGTFGPEVQQFAAENVVRTFVRTHVEDFATLLIGGASGWSVSSIVYNQLQGYIRALHDADDNHSMRRITLCERDPERFAEMKEEVYRLASTNLFQDVRVTFDECRLPEPTIGVRRRARARVEAEAPFAYLSVRQEQDARASRRGTVHIRTSLLTAGAKATVLTGTRALETRRLGRALARIESAGFTFRNLERFGATLADLVLDKNVAAALRDMQDHHLVVIHDAATSRIPWETLCIDGWFPGARKGLSRRYAADHLSAAKWLEQRRIGRILDVLLVVNPTEDLDGAEAEGDRLKRLFPQSTVRLHEVRGAEATRGRLLAAFQSGDYDVVHYAGHAFFDSETPSQSGILCAEHQVLSGADLAGISNVPALLFFNACEAGRVRRGASETSRAKGTRERIDRNVGFAEAFMRGGAANYIGTYWPVGDRPAKAFAETFYKRLVAGRPIGEAVQAGRKRVRNLRSVDWADYIHYGSYDFVLKGLPQG